MYLLRRFSYQTSGPIRVVSTFRWPGNSARQCGTSMSQLRYELQHATFRNRSKLKRTFLQHSTSNVPYMLYLCAAKQRKRHVARVISAECTAAHLFVGAQSTACCVCVRCLASRANTKCHSACRTRESSNTWYLTTPCAELRACTSCAETCAADEIFISVRATLS